VAHGAASTFPDGQLYANLRGFANGEPVRPIEALAWFLGALGVASERIPTEVDAAVAYYRTLTAGRRLLLVLDNAADADQARPLLPGGNGTVVLVTSRRSLTGLVVTHGATRLTVAPMEPGEAVDLMGRLLGAGRVTAEGNAVRALIEECARLPLALRIAAANLWADPDVDIDGYLF
jgi:hypothetical protein